MALEFKQGIKEPARVPGLKGSVPTTRSGPAPNIVGSTYWMQTTMPVVYSGEVCRLGSMGLAAVPGIYSS